MKSSDLQPGVYVGHTGDRRRLVRFLDSRRRKGATDSVEYAQLTSSSHRSPVGGPYICLRRSFARWAAERVEGEG
jgi:hypothetical protein